MRRSERRFLFIAGGTGIAPLRSMIRHAVLRARPGRIALLYSARTPADFAYLTGAAGHGAARQAASVADRHARNVRRDGAARTDESSPPQLTPLVEDPATLCFVCGPAAMVSDVPLMLQALGNRSNRIRLEDW